MTAGKTEKNSSGIRRDSRRVRLRQGESQRDNGKYTYRWTDEAGKRNAVYAETLEDLRAKEEKIARDTQDGIHTDTNNLSVNDMYELWKKLKKGIKDSTMQNYVYMYEMFVMPVFGRRKLTDVRKSDVKAFYNGIIDRKSMEISTLDGLHNVLHQVFQTAVDDDLIRRNPTDGMLKELKLACGRPKQKEALTAEQERLFFSYMESAPEYRHWHDIFFIMANTGMRVGELTGLTWNDVSFDDDLRSGMLSINHTLVYYDHRDGNGCYYSINTPKTQAGCRKIPMTESVCRAFRNVKEYQEEHGIHCRSSIDGYSDFVFLNRCGKVHNQMSLNREIHRIVRKCNLGILEQTGELDNAELLPYFTCHVLRHTFATRCAESGKIEPKTLQSILGHADISTTFNIYVSVTEHTKKIEIEAYEEFRNNYQIGE